MWQDLLTRLRLLVMRGRVQIVDDAGPAQLVQVQVLKGWTQDKVPRLGEYGLHSCPPVGADVVMLYLGGNPSDGVVIATGHQQYRLHLQPGEVAISDDKGQKVHLSATGIRIDGAALPIEVKTTGNVKIDAARTDFVGLVWANGKRIDNLHYHPGGTLAGNTGTVA